MDPPSIPPPPPRVHCQISYWIYRRIGWHVTCCGLGPPFLPRRGGRRRKARLRGRRRPPASAPRFPPPQPLRSYYYSSTYSRVCILLSRSILARTGPCNYIYIYIYIVALAHCASVIRPTKNIHPHQRPISHHHQTTFSPHTHTHAHTHSPAPT